MDNTGGAAEWSGPDIARVSARGIALSDRDGLAACPWSETNQTVGGTGGRQLQGHRCSKLSSAGVDPLRASPRCADANAARRFDLRRSERVEPADLYGHTDRPA